MIINARRADVDDFDHFGGISFIAIGANASIASSWSKADYAANIIDKHSRRKCKCLYRSIFNLSAGHMLYHVESRAGLQTGYAWSIVIGKQSMPRWHGKMRKSPWQPFYQRCKPIYLSPSLRSVNIISRSVLSMSQWWLRHARCAGRVNIHFTT